MYVAPTTASFDPNRYLYGTFPDDSHGQGALVAHACLRTAPQRPSSHSTTAATSCCTAASSQLNTHTHTHAHKCTLLYVMQHSYTARVRCSQASGGLCESTRRQKMVRLTTLSTELTDGEVLSPKAYYHGLVSTFGLSVIQWPLSPSTLTKAAA